MENNFIKDEKDELKEEKVPLGDRITDAIDDFQDAILGPGDDFQNDIPAVHKLDSGRRLVNKNQTRKNINKKIFGKWGYKFLAIVIGLGLIIGLAYYLIYLLLMK